MKNGLMAIFLILALFMGDRIFAAKDIDSLNHVVVKKSLQVTGPSTFTGAITATGGFGNTWINGTEYIKTGLWDSGYAKIKGAFNAFGAAYFSAANGLVDSGTSTLLGTITIGAGAATITDLVGRLVITEDSVGIVGKLNISGDVNAFSSLYAHTGIGDTGSLYVGTTSILTGNTNEYGSLYIHTAMVDSGNTTILGTLQVGTGGTAMTSFTVVGDSVCVVIGGTNYYMWKAGAKKSS